MHGPVQIIYSVILSVTSVVSVVNIVFRSDKRIPAALIDRSQEISFRSYPDTIRKISFQVSVKPVRQFHDQSTVLIPEIFGVGVIGINYIQI